MFLRRADACSMSERVTMGLTMSDLSERLKELGSGLGGFCAGEALPKTGES